MTKVLLRKSKTALFGLEDSLLGKSNLVSIHVSSSSANIALVPIKVVRILLEETEEWNSLLKEAHALRQNLLKLIRLHETTILNHQSALVTTRLSEVRQNPEILSKLSDYVKVQKDMLLNLHRTHPKINVEHLNSCLRIQKNATVHHNETEPAAERKDFAKWYEAHIQREGGIQASQSHKHLLAQSQYYGQTSREGAPEEKQVNILNRIYHYRSQQNLLQLLPKGPDRRSTTNNGPSQMHYMPQAESSHQQIALTERLN